MQAEIHLVFLCLMGGVLFLLALCFLGIWWNSR